MSSNQEALVPPTSATATDSSAKSLKRERSSSFDQEGGDVAGPSKRLNTGTVEDQTDKKPAEMSDG